MAVLQPSEYDVSYFDGRLSSYTHNAGYTQYARVANPVFGRFANQGVPIEESTGNTYFDMCKALNINLNSRFIGKSLLVLGCAYGFEVAGFRSLGIDAWGLDVSQYAYDQADPAIQPYLTVGDARIIVPTYGRNQWDYVFSKGFIECMSDDDLTVGTFAGTPLLDALNRTCKSDQVHIMHWNGDPGPDANGFNISDYYNLKTLAEWQQMDFEVGTILVHNYDFANYVTVIN